MKFEYQQDSLVLKVLDTSHTGEVLDFYKRNKDSFEKYETDKPSNFYTYTFIYNLLKAEYNACIHGKHIRFFLYGIHGYLNGNRDKFLHLFRTTARPLRDDRHFCIRYIRKGIYRRMFE